MPWLSPALGRCPRASSPQPAQPLAPGLGFLRAPCIVLSGKREGQSSGHSSAPDTRWLRGSARFFERSAGFLSPPRWWAPLCLSSARSVGGQPWGTDPGTWHTSRAAAPRDWLPGQARMRLGAAPVGGGSRSGPQCCVLCHLGMTHCRVHGRGAVLCCFPF